MKLALPPQSRDTLPAAAEAWLKPDQDQPQPISPGLIAEAFQFGHKPFSRHPQQAIGIAAQELVEEKKAFPRFGLEAVANHRAGGGSATHLRRP
jgi:hypothetical protein